MKNKNVKFRISSENCFYGIDPELIMKIDYVIFERNRKWYLQTNILKFSEKPEKRTFSLENTDIDPKKYLEILGKIKIQIVPEEIFGLDGGYTELEIFSGINSLKAKWWSNPPKEWEKLDKATSQFMKQLENVRTNKPQNIGI